MCERASEFRQALERVCTGSEEDALEFIQTYGPHIHRVVRRRLHQSMRSKFDSLDFVQMVWASFFADPQRIARIKDPDGLIRYLVTMARNKVIEESRRRLATKKHDVQRERPLDRIDVAESPSRQRQATPSQIAMARERWRRMLRDQSERNRRIVELRMGGATFAEIGRALGIHERTARQVIDGLALSNAE